MWILLCMIVANYVWMLLCMIVVNYVWILLIMFGCFWMWTLLCWNAANVPKPPTCLNFVVFVECCWIGTVLTLNFVVFVECSWIGTVLALNFVVYVWILLAYDSAYCLNVIFYLNIVEFVLKDFHTSECWVYMGNNPCIFLYF